MPECSKQTKSWAQIRSEDVHVRWARQTFLPFSLCRFRSRYHWNQHRLEIYVRFNRWYRLGLFRRLFCYSILLVQQVYGINLKTSCKLQLKCQIYQAGENRNECNAHLLCFFGFHSTVCSIHKRMQTLFFCCSKTLLYQLEMIHSMVTKQKKLCIKPEAFMALAIALSPLIKIKQ